MSKPSQGVVSKTATTTANTTTATASKTAATSKDASQVRALTEKLAYELWEKRGRKGGSDVQDWLEAEKLARQRLGL